MLNSKVFIYFLVSFLFWVFISNILYNINFITIYLSISLMFLFILFLIFKKHHFILIIIWFWLTIWSVFTWTNNHFVIKNQYFISNFFDKEVLITWEIKELYKKSPDYNSYILKLNSIWNYKIIDTYSLIYYPKNYILKKWDIISTKTKLKEIDNFSNNFNYKKYLLSKNIYFQIFPYQLEITDKRNLSKLDIFLINTRQNIIDKIYSLYPNQEAIFLWWILIWAREDMPKEMQNSFNNSWLTHLVAVSGFNITIIIIFLWFLLKFFPIILRTTLIISFVVFFVFLVWDNIPVVRAWIMWIIWYLILISWRSWDSLILLLFTAFLLILLNPLILNYDSSFHLSFLAVVWLLYFQKFWEKIFFFLPKFFAIRESFILTISAFTTTLPIMIFNFWQVSIFAPIANMLVGWIIPFAMLFWFLSILWLYVSSTLWFLLWFINYFFLKYVILIANFFWNLDFALFKIDFWKFNVYIEMIYFFMLIFFIIYFKQKESFLTKQNIK